jgi:hypothetical protein
MAKLTLNDLANLNNQTSAVNTINNNNQAIEFAVENTLSRDGTRPNTMGADLDLNGHDLLNVGTIHTIGHPEEELPYTDMIEIAPPANPAPNTLRLYAIDEGGVTRLVYKDSQGKVYEASVLPSDSLSVGNLTVTGPVSLTNHADLRETVSPGSPPVDTARLFAYDSQGTTRVAYKDSTGNVVPWGGGTADFRDFVEIAPPSNPAADTARLFAYDDAGVTRVAYKDSTGTVVPWGSDGTTPPNYNDYQEIIEPNVPATNVARLFSFDDAGVTRMAYKDAAGAVTVLKEPATPGSTDYQDLPEILEPFNPPVDTVRIYAYEDAGVTQVAYKLSDGTIVPWGTTGGTPTLPDFYDLEEIPLPGSPPVDTARLYAFDDAGVTRLAYKNSAGGITVLRDPAVSPPYADYQEIATPSAPATDVARLYALDDSGTTRLAYKDSAGVVTVIKSSVAGTSFPLVTSLTELATLSTATTTAAYLSESGRSGLFVFKSENLAARVTNDPQQGIYVASIFDPDGSTGAWVRQHNPGELWVNWFGAVGDDVADDTAAIQAAVTYATIYGGLVRLGSGIFKTSAAITINESTQTSEIDGTRTAIRGNGPGSTIIRPVHTTGYTLTYGGSTTLPGGIVGDFTIEDLKIDGNLLVNGMYVSSATLFSLTNVHIFQCNIGLSILDSGSFSLNNCSLRYNVKGAAITYTTGSVPDSITFNQCYIGYNTEYGMHILGGAGVRFFGGTVEFNGTGVASQRFGLKIEDSGVKGLVGFVISGTNFDKNGNVADVWITQTTPIQSIHDIRDANFVRRTGGPPNCIRMDCGATVIVHLLVDGCGFAPVAGYTPSAGTPFINTANCLGAAWRISFGHNRFGNATEAPVWQGYTPTVTAGAGAPSAYTASGSFMKHGKMLHIRIQVSVTAIGTASGPLVCSLPEPCPTGIVSAVLAAVDVGSTKGTGSAYVQGSNCYALPSDRTTYWVNGSVVVISGVFETQA